MFISTYYAVANAKQSARSVKQVIFLSYKHLLIYLI